MDTSFEQVTGTVAAGDNISALKRMIMPWDITAPSDIVEVMGLRIHNVHGNVIAHRVAAAALTKQKILVVNANAHFFVTAIKNPWMWTLFANAHIAFCDGAGVQLAARILGAGFIHRSTPPEWIGVTLKQLGPRASIFWLGGTQEVALEAARRYEEQYNVQTAGVMHGFFDMAPDSADSLELVERINKAAPSIILINMGMPRQEQWLWDNWHRLNPCVAITAGALVNHAAGLLQRPPRWVADLGLEWLIRLVHEPRRLWRRYLIGLPVFFFYMLHCALIHRNEESFRYGPEWLETTSSS